MRVISDPRGRAREYSLLALNLFGRSRCQHLCSYCYCPSAMRMSRQQWEAQPFRPRKDVIRLLRDDAKELAGDNRRVLLCFFGDPYSPEAAASGVTRQALEILREHDIPFQLLTKGGTRAAADFDLYGPHDAFATTMTFMDEEPSLRWEPGAAIPDDRFRAIVEAKGRGIETWVSLEPVLDPEQSLAIIKASHADVDLYKIGVLNHDPRAKDIDWRNFGVRAIGLCEKYRNKYYVKHDLAKHLEGVTYQSTDTRRIVRTGATK